MIVHTIGFTQTSAENFFRRLSIAGAKKIIDVRLKADSQLSGFAKKKDLAFFAQALSGASYVHETLLAPTADILSSYKDGKISWADYSRAYITLLENRAVESIIDPSHIDNACFLCSEANALHCHRRLAAEYLAKCWKVDLMINHI